MIILSREHRPQDYRFAREITDGIKLEPTKAIEPLWKSIAAGIGLMLFIALIVVLF